MSVCPNCGYRHADKDFIPELGAMKLPNKQHDVVLRLSQAQGGWVAKPTLIDFVYGDDLNGGPDDADLCIESHIHKARAKIKPLGWTIESARFRGARLVRLPQ
jgi:DNA-binding response OmpR family regulator